MTDLSGKQVGDVYQFRQDPAYLAAEARGQATAAADTGAAATDALAGLTGATVTASAALAAGDLVNVWASGGAKVRKADATDGTRPAHGFVLAAVAIGDPAAVYPLGLVNAAKAGLTPGAAHYLDKATPGGVTTAAPAVSGNAVQLVGVAVSATALLTAAQPQSIVP